MHLKESRSQTRMRRLWLAEKRRRSSGPKARAVTDSESPSRVAIRAAEAASMSLISSPQAQARRAAEGEGEKGPPV